MLPPGVIGLVPLGVVLSILLIINVELAWAQHHDGQVLRSLRGVFGAMWFLLLFPFVAGVARIYDADPLDDELVLLLDMTIWIARCALATALIHFWLQLHRWARQKWQETKP